LKKIYAILQLGLGNKQFDEEGRLVAVEFAKDDLEFVLINAYYPQGGRGPHRIEYKLNFYIEVFKLVQSLQKANKNFLIEHFWKVLPNLQDLLIVDSKMSLKDFVNCFKEFFFKEKKSYFKNSQKCLHVERKSLE
jgi:exonuclease III